MADFSAPKGSKRYVEERAAEEDRLLVAKKEAEALANRKWQESIKYYLLYGPDEYRKRYGYGDPREVERRPMPQIPTLSQLYSGEGGGYEVPEMPEVGTYDVPEMDLPDIYKPGDLEMPEYDQERISSLSQQYAAPQARTLKETFRAATQPVWGENPNVRRMTVRDALAGVATGLSGIQAQATQTAAAQYLPEFQTQAEEALQEWGAANIQAQQEYTDAVGSARMLWREETTKAKDIWREGETREMKEWEASLALNKFISERTWQEYQKLFNLLT